MSASSAPTTPRRDVDAMLDAMDDPTPVAPSRKCPHTAIDPASDHKDDDNPLPTNIFAANSCNVVQMLQHLRESKCLHPNQITDGINADPPAVQGAKMILGLHALFNHLEAFEVGKAPFTVSDDTETNIAHYTAAILLSTKLSAYKGSIAKNILLDLLKINRFDLPSNIEHNLTDYAKLVAVVREALTQMRSKIKKGMHILAASFKVNKEPAPSAREHQNIFELTTHLIHGTKCAAIPEPCAHVVLMWQVYIEESGPRFWDSLNTDLRKIRDCAGGNPRKLNKAFENVLSTDRATHSVNDYSIPSNIVDEVQHEVDDTISAAAVDRAATIPTTAEMGDADEDLH
ncbi:hypothetical protein DFH08DRAFT_955976 [Mycena albidolilacea]|uniref:Uncharacterized protein n=1 Tax=Mycena albidolilacea TaxID=1033008 RepID=A0AAD7AC55_9AGAR|nr:hypothetical protein DFH08DRAFT_955976 [Mycena albidolilacea]